MSLKDLSLLYVEDDKVMIELIKNSFKDRTKNIIIARNGEEGIKAYERYKPDIILSDMQMPVMDGLEMSSIIKAKDPKQPIILLTAMNNVESLRKAIDIKIDKYILKPILDLNSLIEDVEDIGRIIHTQIELASKEHELKQKDRIIDENVLISTSDLDGNITSVSKALLKLSGYDKDELIGKNHNIFRGDDEDYDKEFYKNMWKVLINDRTWKGEIKNRTKNGEIYWLKATIEPMFDKNGKKIGYTSIKENITDKKSAEFFSDHDALTGVYNRRKLEKYLKKYKNSVDRYSLECCLIMMDIDHFKPINDEHGHLVGDIVLKEFSRLVLDNIRDIDIFARWGGEEFVILSPYLDIENAKSLASKLKDIIAAHSFSEGVSLTTSFGVSMFEKDDKVDDIIKRADEALYRSKENGRNRVSVSET